MPITRGIPQVPIVGKIPDGTLRSVLVALRQNVSALVGQQQAPAPVTGLKATGLALSNLVQWSTSNAGSYIVYWSTKSNINPEQGNPVNVGNSSQYADPVGAPNVARWYWVRSFNPSTQQYSGFVGPVTATTKASTSTTPPPVAPPTADVIVVDAQTGILVGRGRITKYY
jgi:hypothetical protein